MLRPTPAGGGQASARSLCGDQRMAPSLEPESPAAAESVAAGVSCVIASADGAGSGTIGQLLLIRQSCSGVQSEYSLQSLSGSSGVACWVVPSYCMSRLLSSAM